MRRLAVLGFALVALMQVIFVAAGGDRAFPYREVQALSVLASLAVAWGIASRTPVALSAGLAVNALMRLAQIVLGLSRLPLALNLALFVGWAWAAADAGRGRAPRAALWLLAATHALSMLWVVSRLAAAVALALGAAGLFLAAPNLRE